MIPKLYFKTALFITLILTIAFSLIQPDRVFAEGEVPEGTPQPTIEPTPQETINDSDEDAEPVELPEPVDDSILVTPDVVNAEVVVVDSQGTALPLASEAALQAIQNPDPYFFKGGTKYEFTETDCDPSEGVVQACDNPIQAAINYLATRGWTPDKNKIYVEAGTYDVAAAVIPHILIDGDDWGNSTPVLLFISGAGSDNNPLTGTVIVGNFTVNNMKNFTLSGVFIEGGITAANNTGTLTLNDVTVVSSGADGIDVQDHIGAVNLTKVNVIDSDEDGAEIQATGNVTVKESSFNQNAASGLIILTPKNILLDNVAADNNLNGNGITITGTSGNGSFTFTNKLGDNSAFNNIGKGLFIQTSGNIFVSGMQSTFNTFGGGEVLNNAGTGTVTIQNSTFNQNTGFGLDVKSKNAISLSLVEANQNALGSGNYGAQLDNSTALSINKAIVVVNSSFNQNGAFGINILSKGSIILRSVTASSNSGTSDGYGAYIFNDIAAKNPPIVKIESSSFNDNATYGLNVVTRGNITLNMVTADNNFYGNGIALNNLIGKGYIYILNSLGVNSSSGNAAGSGLIVETNGAITIRSLNASQNQNSSVLTNNTGTSSIFIYQSHFDNNNSTGLNILTRGSILLENSTANGNQNSGNGVLIDNVGGKGNITILRSQFNFNNANGITISSNGTVLIRQISANNNTLMGASINNNGTLIRNVSILGNLGENSFNLNGDTGLRIDSRGAVTLYNILVLKNILAGVPDTDPDTEEYRHGGIFIDNTFGSAGVSIKNANISYNSGVFTTALNIASNGAIYISNLIANNNHWGADVNNLGSAGAKNGIKIYQSTFNNNENAGIIATSAGTIISNNLTAMGNQGPRAVVFQNVVGNFVGVSVLSSLGNNLIINNTGLGLEITTSGNVTLSNLNASSNGGIGVTLPNPIQGEGNVKIINSLFENNGDTGLIVQTSGAITLINVSASFNGGSDLSVGAYLAGGARTITVYRSFFNGNTGSGLIAIATGKITLNSILANDNAHAIPNPNPADMGEFSGILLQNNCIDCTAGITISNSYFNNEFNRNTNISLVDTTTTAPLGIGMNIRTYGSLVIRGVSASDNGMHGAYMINSYSELNNVSISGARFESNRLSGLWVQTLGNITLTKVIAGNTSLQTGQVYGDDPVPDGYKGSGAYLINSLDYGGHKKVTILNGKFDNNYGVGLRVISNGSIKLVNVTASQNTTYPTTDPYGAYLSNFGSPPEVSAGISITGNYLANQFSDNALADGLFLRSKGNLVIQNTIASNNGKSGIYYINSSNINTTKLNTLQTNNNAFSGVFVYTQGSIFADKISANHNGSGLNVANLEMDFLSAAAVYLSNQASTTGRSQVLVSRSQFNDNYSTGLRVYSSGNITVNSIQALGNRTAEPAPPVGLRIDGAYLQNSSSSVAVNVNVLSSYGANRFDNNRDYGLHIYARQNITVSRATANSNGILDPAAARSGMNFVVKATNSKITLNCVTVTSNGQHGIWVEYQGGGTGGKLLLKGCYIGNNALAIPGSDLYIDPNYGTPTLIQTGSYCSGW